jgi:hypothetical protein
MNAQQHAKALSYAATKASVDGRNASNPKAAKLLIAMSMNFLQLAKGYERLAKELETSKS